MLEDPEVVSVDFGVCRRFTTRELLRAEAVIVGHAEAGQGQSANAVSEIEIERALAALPVRLSEEQAAVVGGIACSGNRIDVVEALAGTGKTTSAAALREVYERAGYRVLGAAPTARAVRELTDRAGIVEARTLDSWALKLQSDPDALRSAGPAVLVIDEAGMANTRISAQVIDRAMVGELKVVAIGDSGQLSPVQAGGWLGALSRRLGAFELREVMRQRDPAERRALAHVHRGQPEYYLKLKHDRGDLSLFTRERPGVDAERALVARWTAEAIYCGAGEAVMICRDNHRRERLNQQAREALRQFGQLGPDLEIAGRVWAVGDRVIARRNDRHRDLDNGMRGTITHLDEHHGATIRLDAGATRRLDPEYLAGHVEHAYALTGHGMQGATVQWAGVIGQPHDFSKNWAYTALSRAREPVELYLIDEPRQIEQDRDQIAPSRHGRAADPLERMGRRMRERDDEDLAHDQLQPQPLGHQQQAEISDRARRPARQTAQEPEPASFVSPSRQRYYDLQRELAAVHEQRDALPIQEAQSAIALGKTIALNEESRQTDRWPRGLRDLSAHRWRKHEREQRLNRLRDLQAKHLDAVPDPQAVLDRAQQLEDRQTELARERHRQREQAITEELDHQPPWLEHTLGPEPEHRDRREDWQDTARQIAGHRIDHHITDPHTALHQHDHHLGLAQTIKETRVALGLDAPKHDHDIGYEM